MGLDGGFLHCLLGELNIAIGCKVDKVYQPSKDELVIALRSKEYNGRLFISANPATARMHFTTKQIENPAQPPMLCMLLRKHLTGARLISLSQYDLDRVAILEFEGLNEMGDVVYPRLVVEMIGRQANIILVGPDGRIIDAVRRSDIEKGGRLIQPGARYELPEKQDKLNPLTASAEDIIRAVSGQGCPAEKAYISALQGLSPAVSRELALEAVPAAANKLREALASGGTPCAAVDGEGNIVEFSYMPLRQYGSNAQNKTYDSFSSLLDNLYAARDAKSRITHQAQQLSKLLNAAKGRTLRKLAYRRTDLARCAAKEDLRIKGELLKANLHLVQPGDKTVRVQNYYDPQLGEIAIPLKEELSPSANATLYFKDYKKLCNAERLLGELIKQGEEELQYIESVADALDVAESTAELNQIKAELESTGYIRRSDKAQKAKVGAPKEYTSPDGFRILVGRNNIQNDRLTFKTAEKQDIWLHVKGFPGAHTIIFTNGASVPESTLIYAAKVTAANTAKTRLSSAVPVDYTLVKRVKKQPGGKPGMVTYTDQKTLYVTPERDM